MDAKQAIQITERLQGAFPGASHWNVKAFCDEWMQNLLRLNYDRAFEATERAVKEARYCPNIGEFNAYYYQIRVTNKEYFVQCSHCDGNGFVIFKKLWEGRMYDFAAYCDKCRAGERFNYNGTQLKSNKSDYYTNPFSAYGMQEESTKRVQAPKSAEECRSVTKILENITKNMEIPEVKQYELREFDGATNENTGDEDHW